MKATPAAVVATVVDPELPMLTLADLGIIRDVGVRDGTVIVTVTPTYTGCPAMETIRADIVRALQAAGYAQAYVRTVLAPAWTTDWISPAGREKLAAAGIAPPGPAPRQRVPLVLGRRPNPVPCPRCRQHQTEQIAAFGASTCRDLWRCLICQEPFEHVKEH